MDSHNQELQLYMTTRPTLEDEEVFDGTVMETSYRLDTYEMMNNSGDSQSYYERPRVSDR